jgi:hypothetical protein
MAPCRTRTRVLAALAVLMGPGAARAGAWVPDPGHGYADLQGVVFPGGTHAFGATDPLFQLGAYGYVEVGAAGGWLAALARAPLYVHTFLPRQGLDRGGFGDLGLGARVGLHRGAWPVAVEAWASFPTGRGDGVLPTGFGTWGATGGLYVGHGFSKGWWAQAGALGEWYATYGPALRVEVGAGKGLSKHWSIDGTAILRFAFGPPSGVPERVFYRSDERWGSVDLRVRYAITAVVSVFAGLDAGLMSHNAPIGVPIALGASAKW